MEKHDEIKEKKRSNLTERKCPVCGKNFVVAPYHIYKSKGRMVCSWTCLLKSEGKKEKKDLTYEATSNNGLEHQSKRYAILARRTEKDSWSTWTEIDDLDRALYHRNRCQELGYLSKIVDVPIETYLNRGARKAFEALQGYIAENKVQISNENLDSVLKEVLEEVLKAIPTKEQDNV